MRGCPHRSRQRWVAATFTPRETKPQNNSPAQRGEKRSCEQRRRIIGRPAASRRLQPGQTSVDPSRVRAIESGGVRNGALSAQLANDNGEGSAGCRVESVAGFDFDDVRPGLAGRTDESSQFGCESNAPGEATTDEFPPGWTNTSDGRKVGAVEPTQFPTRHLGSPNSQPWCDFERHRVLDGPRFGVSSSCDEAVGARDSRCARDRPVIAESQSNRKPAGTNLPVEDARSTPRPEGQPERYSDFGPKRDSRSGGDPGLCTDSQRELLLRSLPCACAGVVLRLAHLHVELEAAGLERDAAQRSVRHEDETGRQ